MSEHQWTYRNNWLGYGESIGPLSEQELVKAIDAGQVTPIYEVCSATRTSDKWYTVDRVPSLLKCWERGLSKRKQKRPANVAPNAFVSYAREDGESFAKGLRHWLSHEEPEISLWRDREELVGGIGWWKQLEEAIQNVQFLIMIMTPGALKSEVTEKEWRLARQEGVSVLPVMVPEHPVDFDSLPQWMRKKHFYDLRHQRQRFVIDLMSPQREDRVPFMADDLPDGFVDRPREFENILGKVFSTDGEEPIAITTAIHGAGGFGKTTLALAVCHDDRVMNAFDDGILWVTLGEQADLRGALVKLYAALTGDRPDFQDEEDGAVEISKRLADKNCLLVIDDVWKPEHLKPFLRGGPGCTRLITTRRSDIAATKAEPIEIDEMTSDEATQLLVNATCRRNVPKALTRDVPAYQSELRTLSQRLGEWPLLLELAGDLLRKRCQRGQSLHKSIEYVNRALDRHGITALSVRNTSERNMAGAATLQLSLDELEPDERTACLELSIIPEDVDVPLSALACLWETDESNASELAELLADFSLVKFDITTCSLRIHDVVRQFMGEELNDAKAIHTRLIASWGNYLDLPDDYAWQFIVYHLIQSGQWEQLENVLTDLQFIEAKCRRGMTFDLMRDYMDSLNALPEGKAQREKERQRQESLRQYSHALIKYSQEHEQGYPLPDPPDTSAFLKAMRQAEQGSHRIGTISPKDSRDPRLKSFANFVSAHSHVLALTPTDTVLVARNHAEGGVVAECAETLATKVKRLWLARDPRPPAHCNRPVYLRSLTAHDGDVTCVALTPDGRHAISGGSDSTVRFWSVDSGEQICQLNGHAGEVLSVDLTPDSRLAVSLGWDLGARVWDCRSNSQSAAFKGHQINGHRCKANDVAVSNDGNTAVTAGQDRSLRVWDVASGEELYSLSGSNDPVVSVALSAGGRTAVSASGDRIYVWDLNARNLSFTLEGESEKLNSAAITPDGRRIISAGNDGSLCVWEVASRTLVCKLMGHTRGVHSVAMTADGRLAVSGGGDHTVRVWDLESAKQLRMLLGHSGPVKCVAVSADGKTLVSTSSDGIRIWNLGSDAEVDTLPGHQDAINTIELTSDGDSAVSASRDHEIRVWNVNSGQPCRTFQGHQGEVTAIALSRDDKTAISASRDRTLRIWDLQNSKQLGTLTGHTDAVISVAMTPDGKRAVSASRDGSVRLWDVDSGMELDCQRHNSGVNCMVQSSDGHVFVSGSNDSTIRAWELVSRMKSDHGAENILEQRFEGGHREGVLSIAIAPHGENVVSGSRDGTLKVWCLRSGELLFTLKGHTKWVNRVAVTNDGRYAISAGNDDSLRVWDLGTGEQLRVLWESTDKRTLLTLLDNGTTAVSTTGNTLRVWNLSLGTEVAVYRISSKFSALSAIRHDGRLVCGASDGQLYFLTLRNLSLIESGVNNVSVDLSTPSVRGE